MISFYTRVLLLLRRPPCWNKHGAACTTRRHDSHDTSCLCRDATSGIWAVMTMMMILNMMIMALGEKRRTGPLETCSNLSLQK